MWALRRPFPPRQIPNEVHSRTAEDRHCYYYPWMFAFELVGKTTLLRSLFPQGAGCKSTVYQYRQLNLFNQRDDKVPCVLACEVGGKMRIRHVLFATQRHAACRQFLQLPSLFGYSLAHARGCAPLGLESPIQPNGTATWRIGQPLHYLAASAEVANLGGYLGYPWTIAVAINSVSREAI